MAELIIDTSYSLKDVPFIADKVIARIMTARLVLFQGELGSGKTTLIKALINQLNCNETVTSPTYTIVNEYESLTEGIIYHMDLYRLKSMDEAIAIGIDEIIQSNNICFIEWPEVIEDLLDPPFLLVEINHTSDGGRWIKVKKF